MLYEIRPIVGYSVDRDPALQTERCSPMAHPASLFQAALVSNRRTRRDEPYGEARKKILNLHAGREAMAAISCWPGYQPTPLADLRGLAAELGVRTLLYKDESQRFGLKSFKALGGAYAVARLLQRIVFEKLDREVAAAELAARRFKDIIGDVTVTCATDGNHGRSVAWGARTFGCRCVIFIHARVSAARADAIAALGARVERTPGNYDDAVRVSSEEAQRNGWHLVSDTSFSGYTDIPRDVMQGYSVMLEEEAARWEAGPPTHVFVQAGVGGLAAAVCAYFWERFGAARPRIVTVEPDHAACLFESAKAGVRQTVEGDLDTVMAGLACGEVSLLAWEILETGVDFFTTIPDAAALEVMRRLAGGCGGDPPLVGGESGVAGLAGLIAGAGDPAIRGCIGLDARSTVFTIGTEGDTDPELYERITGYRAEEILQGRSSPKSLNCLDIS